jgi:hypothetical protein
MARGNARDILAGLLFVAFGAATVAIASGYRVGTLTAMGPGFMPIAAGAILVAIGLVVLVGGLLTGAGASERINPSLVVLLVLPVMAFGYVLERVGLLAATSALVLVSRVAAPGRAPVEIILLAMGLTAMVWGIFIAALGLPLPILPRLP